MHIAAPGHDGRREDPDAWANYNAPLLFLIRNPREQFAQASQALGRSAARRSSSRSVMPNVPPAR